VFTNIEHNKLLNTNQEDLLIVFDFCAFRKSDR